MCYWCQHMHKCLDLQNTQVPPTMLLVPHDMISALVLLLAQKVMPYLSSQHGECNGIFDDTISIMWQVTCYHHIHAKNWNAPKMPKISQTHQVVQVHIQGNYVSIYASYELTAINNVTRNIVIYTFHTIGIYSWTSMPTTLHTYVPLHCYYSLHRPNITAYTSTKNATFIIHAIAIYTVYANNKYNSQMPHITSYFMCKYETTMSVCMPHINSLQSTIWPDALVYIHFTLLAYAPNKYKYTCHSAHMGPTTHLL